MDFDEIKSTSAEIYHKLYDVAAEYYTHWRENQLFGWRWWIGLALIILPWVIWFILRKKDSSHRLLVAGFIAWITSSLFDMIGVYLGLWSYPVSVFPLMPCFIAFDFCILPVMTMLFIQYFPKINPYYKAIVYTVLGSLVFQPIMEWIGFVYHEKWPLYFSLPVLFFIYLASHWTATKNLFEPIG